MRKDVRKNSGKTVGRLMKLMFSFFPVILPLTMILILANAVISAVPSIFQQKIIAILQNAWTNQLTWSDVSGDIWHNVRLLAILYVCSLAAGFAYNQLMAVITQGTLHKLRMKVFHHMESLPIRYFDTNKHGDIMSHYTNDIEALRQMISQSFPQLLVSSVILITILCIMFYYSIPMALVILAGSAVSLVITRKVGGKSARSFIAQQKTIGETEGFIEEMINGQKVIKVFNHEEETKKRFDEVNERLYEDSRLANTYSNTLMPILNNVSYFIYVFVAVAGGIFIEYKVPNLSISGLPFTIAVVVPFLNMSRQFAGNIQQISPQINSVVTEKNGTLEETEESTGKWAWKHPHQADGTITYTPLRGDVRFYDVDFAYNPDKVVLHNITLYGKPGQKIAFVGATGAGKTTITNLINRFYDIADGKIRYDGININKIRKADLRHSLGIVLQDTVLFTGTVMDNIRYGRLDATDEECMAAARLAGADSFIRHLPEGYQTMLSGNGANLSQGQCQLLAIARAAVADPPVMILDEATSSIDTRTEQIVQEGMDRLMMGRTVFVIAHRLSTVKNANVIIVLDHGHIIERGTHEELIAARGQYYQLYTGAFELE